MNRAIKLGDVANVTAGQSAPQGNCFSDEGTPFVRAGSLEPLLSGRHESELELVSEDVAKKNRLKLQPVGTIVFAKSGMSCMKGYVYVLKRPCYVVSHLACVLPKSGNSGYLSYYFKWHKPNLLIKDEAYPSISLADISNITMEMHSESEQEKIVERLDKVAELIALRKRQLDELDTIVKSQFVEMFGEPTTNPLGWDVKPLGDTCQITTGNTPPRAHTEYYGDFIEWIKTDNIVATETTPTRALEGLSEQGFEKCRYVEAGSILMTCIAGSLNTIGNTTITNRRVAFNQQINALTPFEYDAIFLRYLLMVMKKVLCESVNMMLKGILSKGRLSEINAIVPPLPLQNRFAAFAEAADKSKFEIRQGLKQLELQYNALMQQYFG
jgi:type I restriction enzyme S subunit